MRTAAALPVLLTVGLAACAGAPVSPSSDSAAARKPDDCAIEFLMQPPARPYEPLDDLLLHVTNPTAAEPYLALRPKACRLGADAVIVTRSQVLDMFGHALVEGTAIKYLPPAATPAPTPPAEPPATPPAEAPAPPAEPPAPASDPSWT